MSFYWQHEGSAQEVSSEVRSAVVSGDATQADMVKRFILEHLRMFPGTAHVTVSASGHHFDQTGTLNLTIGHTQPTTTPAAQDEPPAL